MLEPDRGPVDAARHVDVAVVSGCVRSLVRTPKRGCGCTHPKSPGPERTGSLVYRPCGSGCRPPAVGRVHSPWAYAPRVSAFLSGLRSTQVLFLDRYSGDEPILFRSTAVSGYPPATFLTSRQPRLLPFPSPPPAYAALVVVTTPSASGPWKCRHQQEHPPTLPSPAGAAAHQQPRQHRSSCQLSAPRTVQTKRSEVAGCAKGCPPASRPPPRSLVAGTAEYSSDVRRRHSLCQAPSWEHSTAPRPLRAVRRARSGRQQQPHPSSVPVPEGSRASNGPEHRIGSSGPQHLCRRPRLRRLPRHHPALRQAQGRRRWLHRLGAGSGSQLRECKCPCGRTCTPDSRAALSRLGRSDSRAARSRFGRSARCSVAARVGSRRARGAGSMLAARAAGMIGCVARGAAGSESLHSLRAQTQAPRRLRAPVPRFSRAKCHSPPRASQG